MQRVRPFSYSIFIVRYQTGRDYRVPPLSFFGTVRLCFEFFLSPKGPPSSFLIFYSKLKFQKAQRVSPFKFFGTMRLAQNSYSSIFRFFSNIFLLSRKGPPSIFKIFCNIIDIKQSHRVPYFRFFGTMRLFKIVIFRLKLGFLSIYLPIIFPKLIRNLDVISWVKRYIRIFDVIAELYSVLYFRVIFPNYISWVKRYIRIFDVISELYSVLPRRRRRSKKRSHLGQHAISEVWDVKPRNKLDFQKTQRVPPLLISKSLSFWALDMAPTLDVPVLFYPTAHPQ